MEETWPAVGSKFSHRIGLGVVRFPGSTTVLDSHPPDRFVLAAGMGPFGEAKVRFELDEIDGGTSVRIVESTRRGIARWLA